MKFNAFRVQTVLDDLLSEAAFDWLSQYTNEEDYFPNSIEAASAIADLALQAEFLEPNVRFRLANLVSTTIEESVTEELLSEEQAEVLNEKLDSI